MTAPVVTVTEQTDLAEIARLLAIHHVKRVPVLRDGRIVGIVSRADLLRALAEGIAPPPKPAAPAHPNFLLALFGGSPRPRRKLTLADLAPAAPAEPESETLAAGDFRHLAEDFHDHEAQRRDEGRRRAAELRRERARELIDAHVFDAAWRGMMHRAREAAAAGERESMLLQFPSQTCIDGGRAINAALPDWPASLRGEPAEIYLRWERDLRPRGFGLSARVLDFPDGKPGDIGLSLSWGG